MALPNWHLIFIPHLINIDLFVFIHFVLFVIDVLKKAEKAKFTARPLVKI